MQDTNQGRFDNRGSKSRASRIDTMRIKHLHLSRQRLREPL
jgi:hypothetical protein